MKIKLGVLRKIIREELARPTKRGLRESQVEVGASDVEGNDLWVTANVELSPRADSLDGFELIDVKPDGWSGSVDIASFEAGLTGDRLADFEERLFLAAVEQLPNNDDDGIGPDWDDIHDPTERYYESRQTTRKSK
jgi:hypothetical protein